MKKLILLLVLIMSVFSSFAYTLSYDSIEDIEEFRLNIDSSEFASLNAYNQYTVPKKDGVVYLLDYISYDPGLRDQGYFGNCWVWSSMLSTELAFSIEKGIEERLSIQHFDSNYKEEAGENANGGWYFWFSDVINIIGKVIPWDNENADYKDYYGDSNLPSSKINEEVYYPVNMDFARIKTNNREFSLVESDIKYYLDHGKVVGFAFFMPRYENWVDFSKYWGTNSSDDVINFDSLIGSNNTWSDGAGHAINIVGYNEIERYWIVSNSWGNASGNREDGTFKMTMDFNYSYLDSDNDNFYYFWIHEYEFGNEKGLRIEPEKDSKINIEKIQFDKPVADAGDVITSSVKIENDYEYMNLKNVRVTYYIQKLGMKRSVGPFDVDMFEDVMKRVYLDIPKNAKPGVYDVRVVLQTENTKEVRYETITIN